MVKKTTALSAALNKTVLASATGANTVEMPKAVSEIHVGRDEVIEAGTLITDQLADEIGLDEATIGKLELSGHVTFVEVHVMAAAPVAGEPAAA